MSEEIKPEEKPIEKPMEEIRDPKAVYELAQKTIQEKREMKNKLEAMEQELESFRNVKLEEEKKFKELADEYRKKYETEKETNTKFQQSLVEAKKKQSLISQLEKLGIKSDRKDVVMQLAKLDAIKYDDEYKIALGFEEEATRIKNSFPEFFGTNGIGTSSDAPDVGSIGVVDLASWKKMSPEDQKKNYSELRKNLLK